MIPDATSSQSTPPKLFRIVATEDMARALNTAGLEIPLKLGSIRFLKGAGFQLDKTLVEDKKKFINLHTPLLTVFCIYYWIISSNWNVSIQLLY